MLEFIDLKIGEKNKSGIYCITTSINNRIYIGSTKNLSVRFSTHKRDLKAKKHGNVKLQNFVNKYGINKLSFNIIKICDLNNLIEEEQYYINIYKPYYNICKTAGSCLGITHSPETILKHKQVHLSRKLNKIKNGAIKLTTDDVYEIKRMYVLGYPTKEIRGKFSIPKETIYGIVHKRHWKEVPDYVIKDTDIKYQNNKRWNFKKYDNSLVENILNDYYTNRLTGKEIRQKYNLGTNVYKILRGEFYQELHKKFNK